jgi:hypothetical protein
VVPVNADVVISGPGGDTFETLASEVQVPVPDVTFEEAQRLHGEARRLWTESYAQGHAGDMAMAQSETILSVIERRATLATAEAELEGSRQLLVRAVALRDPVAAELSQVLTELDLINPDKAGNLDARLAARTRWYALQDEVEPLRRRLAECQRQVDGATELVRSYEADQVPMAQAEIERAVSALVSIPIDDFGKLVEVAPQTVTLRGSRIGHLVLTPERVRTPHGRHVLSALIPVLQASGLWGLILDYWLSVLSGKVSQETHELVRQALQPYAEDLVEYRRSFVPGAEVRATRSAEGMVATSRGPGGDILPGYDSAQGEAMRTASRGYVGPGSWPSFNGVRTPYGN